MEILKNGDCLPDNDPDLDESDTESGSFDKRLDLELNKQRLNNWPRTQLVQLGVTTQDSWVVALTPSLQGQGRMRSYMWICQCLLTLL